MGKDCGSWFPQHHLDWKSPNIIPYCAPLDLEQQNIFHLGMNSGGNMAYANGTLPSFNYSELTQLRLGQPTEPRGSFYPLPQVECGFKPTSCYVPREKLPATAYENCRVATMPKSGPGCAGKRFLVFDHSGDQTKLIFSSGIEAPAQRLTPWMQKPTGTCNLNVEVPGTKNVLNHISVPVSTEELKKDHRTEMQSEMREDTEELNALLYSDDESDYTEDDEVTSTGHSPSTMTANNYYSDWFQGSTEEVASSFGSTTKKRKMLNGGYEEVPSVVDTASSMKQMRSTEHDSDAESSCGNSKNVGSKETEFSCNKKMRKDKIRETVSILQDIIPDGKGKDAIMVIDEAIQYLKVLKFKAKALGITSL